MSIKFRKIDFHCHLSASSWTEVQLRALFQEEEFHFFLQGGIKPEEWVRQRELKKISPEKIGLCFGVHPCSLSDSMDLDPEMALDELARVLPMAIALGEIGLDYRAPYLEKKLEQKELLWNQLEMAQMVAKPVVLHIVKAHEDFFKIWDVGNFENIRGFVHGFNGSLDLAKEYLSRGLYIGVGGAVCWERNQSLRKALVDIPLEKIFLESDSPDQRPQRWPEVHNSPHSIAWIAETVAHIKGLPVEMVYESQEIGFKDFFGDPLF